MSASEPACDWLAGCDQPATYLTTYAACDCGAAGPSTAKICIDHAAEERADATLGLVALASVRSLQ